jgi:hypothetical protein
MASDVTARPQEPSSNPAAHVVPHRRLARELYAQAMERVDLSLKVAVMARAGISRGEIAEQLGATTREVRQAIDDLKAVAPLIEIGSRPGDEDGSANA